MLWLLDEYRAVWAILCFLPVGGGIIACGVSLDLERGSRLRVFLIGILLMVCEAGAFYGCYTATRSEAGRFASLDDDSTMREMLDLVADFPMSAHRPAAERRIRDAQDRHLAAVGMAGMRSVLLRALRKQSVPPEIVFQVHADRKALDGLKAHKARYVSALGRFSHGVWGLFKAQCAEFDPIMVTAVPGPASRKHVTVVLSYVVTRGQSYVKEPLGYHFDAIELEASWAVYLPGMKGPAFTGATPRASAPHRPHWQGTKHAEQVIGDIVAGKVRKKIAEQIASY